MHASAPSSALCLLFYKQDDLYNMEITNPETDIGFLAQADDHKSKAAMPVDVTSTKLKWQSFLQESSEAKANTSCLLLLIFLLHQAISLLSPPS